MVTVIIFLIILGVLIFVHELGHFVTARRNGVHAGEFGFGFPPRIAGFMKDDRTRLWKFVFGNKEIDSKNTIYSVNLIPLGGFVKIKGEDGENRNDPDSFASKSAWVRVKILAAGVIMNFLLAWFLIFCVLMLGAPEAVDTSGGKIFPNSKIQISEVVKGSPAEIMGMKVGDEVMKNQTDQTGKSMTFNNVPELQRYINTHRGKEITVAIKRGGETLILKGTPRSEIPAGEGALGVALSDVVMQQYTWYEALGKSLIMTVNIIWMTLQAFWSLITGLFTSGKVAVDISGPIGIAMLTKQVSSLGFVYILQFAALISINLGIINALPFPGLDGGRILFIIIEKIKGSPVSQRVERAFHTIGFVLLITLMILVTFRDVIKFFR
jgi:regulator of sigma E protease